MGLTHTHTPWFHAHTHIICVVTGDTWPTFETTFGHTLRARTHKTQQHRYNTLVVPTDWLLTIPSGNPPTCGDKCGTVGTTALGGTGDGRSAAAAAAAAATAAAAAATELAAAEPAGGGGAKAELLLPLLPRFVVLWGPSCGVVLCAR